MESSAKEQILHKSTQTDPWNSDFPSNSGPCDNAHELGTFHFHLMRGTHHFIIIIKYPCLLILLNILIKGSDTCQSALFPVPHWVGQFLGFKMSQEDPRRNSKDEHGMSGQEWQRTVSYLLKTQWILQFCKSLRELNLGYWALWKRLWGYLGKWSYQHIENGWLWGLIHLYNRSFLLRVLQNTQENSFRYLQCVIPLPYCQQTSH